MSSDKQNNLKVREYELWYSLKECAYTLCEAHKRPDWLEDDAKVVHTFTATNFEDARCQQHEYLGWEPYVPMKTCPEPSAMQWPSDRGEDDA